MVLIYSNINRKRLNLPDRVVPVGSVDEGIVKLVDEGIDDVGGDEKDDACDEITDEDIVDVGGDEKGDEAGDDDDDDESRRPVELLDGGKGPREFDDGRAKAEGSIDSGTEDKMLDEEKPDEGKIDV
jgi:hypothetical protein